MLSSALGRGGRWLDAASEISCEGIQFWCPQDSHRKWINSPRQEVRRGPICLFPMNPSSSAYTAPGMAPPPSPPPPVHQLCPSPASQALGWCRGNMEVTPGGNQDTATPLLSALGVRPTGPKTAWPASGTHVLATQ